MATVGRVIDTKISLYAPVEPDFLVGAMEGARGTRKGRSFEFRSAGIWHFSGKGRTAVRAVFARPGGPPRVEKGMQIIDLRKMIHSSAETRFNGKMPEWAQIAYLSAPIFVATPSEEAPIFISCHVEVTSGAPPRDQDAIETWVADYRNDVVLSECILSAQAIVRTWKGEEPASAAFDWMCDVEVGIAVQYYGG